MVPRGARKYTVDEVMRWFSLPKALADPVGHPPNAIPWKALVIKAMHRKPDRRNRDDTLWLTRHVYLHAKHARGLPAVGKKAVATEQVRERFIAGEQPPQIAQALGLGLDEALDALKFEQKAAPKGKAWAKRKVAAPGAPKEKDLHGVPLVQAAIEHAKSHKRKLGKPSKAKLSGFPASFRAWLAVDTTHIECARSGTPKPTTIDKIIGKLGWPAGSVDKKALAGDCYLLDVGDEQATFMLEGKLVDGDWPVLTASVEDLAEAFLAAPGFDVYIAHAVGYFPEPPEIGAVPKAYQKRMRAQAKGNLRGRTHIELSR